MEVFSLGVGDSFGEELSEVIFAGVAALWRSMV